MPSTIPNYQSILLSNDYHKQYLSISNKIADIKMSILDGNDNRGWIDADDNILIEGDTAYIPISGVLLNSSAGLCIKDWFTDYSFLHKQIQSAYNNESVKKVVFNVDSPGGMTLGMNLIANEIKELSQIKETTAIVNGLCCSAAYMLSANCNKIYATPGSIIGSIGVYGLLLDDTEYYAKMGFKVFSVGKPSGKALGREGQEITEEVIARYQESCDDTFEYIVDTVSKYVSREKILELDAKYFEVGKSLEHGLIDGILTAEQTLTNTFPKEEDVSKENTQAPEVVTPPVAQETAPPVVPAPTVAQETVAPAQAQADMTQAIVNAVAQGVALAMASQQAPAPVQEVAPTPTLPNSNDLSSALATGGDTFNTDDTNPNAKSEEAIKSACAFYSKPSNATKEISIKLGENNAN